MTLKGNEYIDEMVRISELVIDKFKSKDVEFDIMPYLYKGDLTDESSFFIDANITLANYRGSEDLKTISHLATFYKSRVAYDPFNVTRYMRSIGHIPYDQTIMEIGIYDANNCGDISKTILLKKYLTLKDSSTSIIEIDNRVKVQRYAYFDGLDIGYDEIGVK